jgi:hydroxylamine reductase
MFCYQCEQTAMGKGCAKSGVCGKLPEVADLQDVIIYQLQGIGYLATEARKRGKVYDEVNRFTLEALFTTVTNVDFDPERLLGIIHKGEEVKEMLKKEVNGALSEAAATKFPEGKDEILKQAPTFTILNYHSNADLRSLQHILLYGLKGMAAYADHAAILGEQDDAIYAFMHRALAAISDQSLGLTELVGLCMECGKVNIRTMELLDKGNTGHYGHPVPVQVPKGLKKGPAIVITGHDLLDLEELLKQTEGQGVNIYTHGEMLPAHGYPNLKKYQHLVGHFGTAWQNQQKEFDGVPAAFVFTTNCIQKPKDSYKANVFTCGLVAWPGVTHIKNRDFSLVIARAKALGGPVADEPVTVTLTTGFGHNTVMGVADKVIAAVKAGAIKHFFLVGGCDGAKPGRNYYTEFVEKTPKDTIILTLACGKFRFNHLDLGTIGGIPRLLDIGQCNDAYSAVKIALALAEAFKCGVNDLPLSLVLSWYEQKAVVILLSLLSLKIKGIRLGPTLPAFITPNVLNVLVKEFDIKPISTPDEDLKAILKS